MLETINLRMSKQTTRHSNLVDWGNTEEEEGMPIGNRMRENSQGLFQSFLFRFFPLSNIKCIGLNIFYFI